MKEFEVTCTNKAGSLTSHDHITHIGNLEGKWRLTKEAAILSIEAKPQTQAFYTVDRTTKKKVYIGVVRGDGNKTPYLRTHADGKWNDNLLALGLCDDSCKIIGGK